MIVHNYEHNNKSALLKLKAYNIYRPQFSRMANFIDLELCTSLYRFLVKEIASKNLNCTLIYCSLACGSQFGGEAATGAGPVWSQPPPRHLGQNSLLLETSRQFRAGGHDFVLRHHHLLSPGPVSP